VTTLHDFESRLRARLEPLDALAAEPGVRSDRDLNPDWTERPAQFRPAAVLAPIVTRPEGWTMMFTERSHETPAHPGQISFPGGRVQADDASPLDTALRETEEEIGLARSHVTLLGRLPEYEIPSGFRITPVVGWVVPPFELALDAFEVASAFEAPLAHFIDAGRYQRRDYRFRGRHRHYMAIPYAGRYVWGATAGMLYRFARVLNAPA
jgi:8-oxo-dGTP pyrophosphatase MutT (NUDIX family)